MSSSNNTHSYTLKAPLFVSNNTTSSSTTTGAAVVTGGLGVAGDSFVSAVNASGLVTASSGLTSTAGTTNLKSTTFAAASTINMGSNVLNSVGTPLVSTDLATKDYVDTVVQGLSTKYSVIATTTANGTLNTAYENGDTIDGITLATGNRILLKDQTTATENGIYTVNASGAPTRAADFATSATVGGAYVFVQQGTLYADTGFVCTNDTGSDIVGTNNLAFVQFSSAGIITAGTGLTKTANVLSVNTTQTQITTVGTLTTLDVFYTGSSSTYSTVLEPSLGTGNEVQYTIGKALSNYDSGVLSFVYAGGTGSSTNYLQCGLYGFRDQLKINSTGIIIKDTIKCGNQNFKVFYMSGTLGAVTTTATPSLPSGCTTANIISMDGYSIVSTEVFPFNYATTYLVHIFANSSDQMSINVPTGSTAVASQSYKIKIITSA